jgi:hypothetical protein
VSGWNSERQIPEASGPFEGAHDNRSGERHQRVVVGFSRAIYAAKGWAYYEANGFFWAKIATFVAVVGLALGDEARECRIS